jgi:tetratricopeptide (TPR) repeat protein
MSDERRAQIRNNLVSKETDELLDIWQNEDVDDWDEEVFEIAKEILLERLGYVPPQSIQKQVAQVLSNVDRYLETGELIKALDECERAIKMNPELAIAYNQRGLVFDEMGRFEKAIANYQAAVHLDPELKDAWFNLSSVEKELEEDFQQSATRQHLDLAREYADNDETEKALEECALAGQAMPSIALAYNYLGMILEELGQLEPAIDAYLKAIQLNPRFYVARENLGNARVRFEEEQYLHIAMQDRNEALKEHEISTEFDEAEELEIAEYDVPVPGWVYLDEKAFLLSGWPGHRHRQGRCGYDPLDTDFEEAHIEGVIIHLLITRKFRTRNPIYLLLMTFMGLLYCLPVLGLAEILQGDWIFILVIITASPNLVVGIALLMNVVLSLRLESSDEYEENGKTFF